MSIQTGQNEGIRRSEDGVIPEKGRSPACPLTEPLSSRELEIVILAAQGYTDKEIARMLGITPGTTRTYWDRVRRKTSARSRTQATVMVLMGEIPTLSRIKNSS